MASAVTGGLEDTVVGGDKVSLMGSNKLSLISAPGGIGTLGDVTLAASGNWATLRLQCFYRTAPIFDQTNTAPNSSFTLSPDASNGENQLCDASLFSAQGRIMGEVQFIAEF